MLAYCFLRNDRPQEHNIDRNGKLPHVLYHEIQYWGVYLNIRAPLRVTRSILGLNVRFNVNIPSKYTISHTYLNWNNHFHIIGEYIWLFHFMSGSEGYIACFFSPANLPILPWSLPSSCVTLNMVQEYWNQVIL